MRIVIGSMQCEGNSYSISVRGTQVFTYYEYTGKDLQEVFYVK